jgi:microfibrillar-associated protein 1
LPFSDSEGEDQKYLLSNVHYEEWKMRELRRIKRDREERKQRENELKEIERRRNMTD